MFTKSGKVAERIKERLSVQGMQMLQTLRNSPGLG